MERIRNDLNGSSSPGRSSGQQSVSMHFEENRPQHGSRTVEWNFFEDVGPWAQANGLLLRQATILDPSCLCVEDGSHLIVERLRRWLAAKCSSEIEAINLALQRSPNSVLVALITDSATCNVKAKKQLSERVWALLKSKQKSQKMCQGLPGLFEDLLDRWEWRFNLYFDVDFLIHCHVLDPSLRLCGLKTAKSNRRSLFTAILTIAKSQWGQDWMSLAGEDSAELRLKGDFISWIKP
eukprot:IDg3493t1